MNFDKNWITETKEFHNEKIEKKNTKKSNKQVVMEKYT